jgi:thiamine phosphate synthase YjbQ (UPF0047 family)
MRIETVRLHFTTDEGASLADITADVNAFVRNSGFQHGLCILTLPTAGCCLTLTPDLDEGVDDLLRIVRTHLSARAAPGGPGSPGGTSDRDGLEADEGGYVSAGVLADCLSLSIRDGGLNLGSWDAVVLLDAMGPIRRPVDVTLVGA